MKKLATLLILSIFFFNRCSDDNDDLSIVQNEVTAIFIASDSTIKVGEAITFTDLSIGNPTQWNWVFIGGEPSTSNEQHPTVTYNSQGSFKVSLSVSNGNSQDKQDVEGLITVEQTSTFQIGDQTTFGLSIRTDFLQSMTLLEDYSIVCTGWSDNENTSEQRTNILVTKFDKDLNLIWHKVIGGSKSDLVRDIISTKDGGFLLSATTYSHDGNIPENNGESDISIIKLNSAGSIDWIKTFGGGAYDGVNKNSLTQIDNGYAFIGFISSDDAGVSGKIGKHDIWLVELDLDGVIISQTILGSTENDFPSSFVKDNNGYTVLSKIGASTADFENPGIWIFHTDLNGNISWKTAISGLNAGNLIKTSDGGFLTLNTNTNNVTDLMLTKLNSQGSVVWEKTYPMPGQESAEDIIELNNEYIILGSSEPVGNDPRHGYAFVARLNNSGEIVHSTLFGDGRVSAAQILQTEGNQFIVGGTKNISDSYIDGEFLIQKVTETN